VVAFGFDRFTTVGTSSVDIDLLRNLGANVVRHPAWFYGKDPLPPDLDVRLPQWVDRIVAGHVDESTSVTRR
jgi:hypothetical protein